MLPGKFVGVDPEPLEQGGIKDTCQQEHDQPQGEGAGHQPQANVANADPKSRRAKQRNSCQEPVDGYPGVYVGVCGPRYHSPFGQGHFENAENVMEYQGQHQAYAQARYLLQSAGGQDEVQPPQYVDESMKAHRHPCYRDCQPEEPPLYRPERLQVDGVKGNVQPELGVVDAKGQLVYQQDHHLPVLRGLCAKGEPASQQAAVDKGPQQRQAQPQEIYGQGTGYGPRGQGQRNVDVQRDKGGSQQTGNNEQGGADNGNVEKRHAVAQVVVPQIVGIDADGIPYRRYHQRGDYCY